MPDHPYPEGALRMIGPWWKTGAVYQTDPRSFQDLLRPLFGTLAHFDRLLGGGAWLGHQGHPRFRAEPQFEPSSLVPGKPFVA
jgi:hypothetical protein